MDLLAWLSQVGTEGERWVLLGKQAACACAVDCVSAFGGERGSCASASVGICREKGREAVAAGVGVGRLGSVDNACA